MDSSQLSEISRDQLDRVLEFFPRVDSKSSVVLGVDAGMLAILVVNAPPVTALKALGWGWVVPMALAFLAVLLLIGLSLWHLYLGSAPCLEGGEASLVYFRAIANRTEPKFIAEFKALSPDAYSEEVLGQVWRNACILKMKFDHLERAFKLLACAVPPWVLALALFTLSNPEAKSLLVK